MRIAIIDCGTNTFNLLIAEQTGDEVNFIFEDKIPVKIGKGGIESKIIVADAYQRALDAMKSYSLAIEKYKVDNVVATSTSAFRSTDNGEQLKKDIFEKTGIDVKIISGDEEALYIYKGVTWAIRPATDKIYLIMDIGGGSTEFILFRNNEILFKESYLLGASRMLEKFKPADPLSPKNIDDYERYYKEVLSDSLLKACNAFPPAILIGSSGFFDTLRKICYHEFTWTKKKNADGINCDIEVNEFKHWYKKMLPMNQQERMSIKGMTNFRAEMMGVSMLLLDYVIRETGVAGIINTSYALKEGVLRETLED